MTERLYAWCEGPIPARARRDSKFCGVRCRQSSHRFGRGMVARELTAEPMRFAYADPPYPGLSARYYAEHPDYAGEVDHRELLADLVERFPHGWALSTSAAALPLVLRLDTCPLDVAVASWHRGHRPTASWLPLNGWEPVLYWRGRPDMSRPLTDPRVDAFAWHSRPRTSDPRRVVGAKPARFAWFLFDLLGARPGDELVDLFPGSGGIGRAWEMFSAGVAPPS